jgi:DNA-binding LacI/PurR family transcriptional regulator
MLTAIKGSVKHRIGKLSVTVPDVTDVERPSADARKTIADVARAAAVSVATVSKVLTGRHQVSPEVRDRVEAAVAEVGYVRRTPQASAPRDALVQLVVKSLRSPFLLGVLDGVQASASRRGASLLVTNTSVGDPLAWRRIHTGYPPALLGTIVVSPDEKVHGSVMAEAGSRPIVIVEPRYPSPDTVPTVSTANWSGGLSAMDHLLDLGHRRIGMIAGGANSLFSMARHGAYLAALNGAGIPVDPRLHVHGDFTVLSGERLGGDMLDLDDPPTAIFAGNDEQALGVLRAARARGVRVPDDLSVVGFDDVPESVWTYPALTTVRQPLAEMSELALQLLAVNAETGRPPRSVEVATDLIVRQSTGARP